MMVIQITPGHLLIVLLYLEVLFCIGLSVSTDKYYSGLTRLLYLKERNCSYVSWCTIVKTEELRHHMFSNKCCSPCSCESNCLQYKNCCPDYQLSKLINGTGNGTLADVMANIREFSTFNETEVGLDTSTYTNGSNQMECVRLQLLPVSPYRPKGISYNVVTKCAMDDADSMTKRLCEDFSNDVHSVSVMSRYTPVQSETSGYVYRNIFCFRCGPENKTNAVQTWRARLVTSVRYYTYFSIYTYNTVDDLLHKILDLKRDNYGSFNILFEPSAEYTSLDETWKCATVDVKTCDKNLNVSEHIMDACTKYTAPVYVLNKTLGQFVVYNNIACLYCNNLLEQDSPCLGNVLKDEPRIEMLVSNGNGAKEDELLNKIFDRTKVCGAGFAFDARKGTCRKIYCPRNYIIANGTCVPLFEEIRGRDYGMFLKVISKSTARDPSDQEVLLQAIQSLIRSDTSINVIDLSMWVSKLGGLLVYLAFSPNETAHGIAERFVMRLLKRHVSTAAGISLVFTSGAVRTQRGSIFTSKQTYHRVVPIDTNKVFHKDVSFLTPGDFCYRIKTDPDEITYSGKEVAVRTEDGDVIIDPNYLYNDDQGGPLVCADQILDMPEDNMELDESTVEMSTAVVTATKLVHEDETNRTSKDLVLGIFLASITIVMITVFIFRHKYTSRDNTQT